jgi:hypothetical protein
MQDPNPSVDVRMISLDGRIIQMMLIDSIPNLSFQAYHTGYGVIIKSGKKH